MPSMVGGSRAGPESSGRWTPPQTKAQVMIMLWSEGVFLATP
jgi:hypothetical protein